MYLIVIAWLYVTLMMAVAEATGSNGTILGAIITFALYGLLPLSIVLYLFGTPARRRAIRARELAERQAALNPSLPGISTEPDTSSHAPTAAQSGAVTSVGKKP